MKGAAGVPAAAAALVLALPIALLGSSQDSASASAGATGQLGVTLSSVRCSLKVIQVGDAIPGGHLQADQYANAKAIFAAATSDNPSDQAALDAIYAALSVSQLRLHPVGLPADEVGLFGLRLSRKIGTAAQLQDPTYATREFIALLTRVQGWSSLAPAQAAGDVVGLKSSTANQTLSLTTAAEDLTATFAGQAGSCAGDESLTGGQASAAGLPAGYALPANTPTPVRVAVDFALSKVGLPYIYAGIGPSGYDCSGLVMMGYLAAGIALERTTYQQVFEGTPVYSTASLEPGDLLFVTGSDPQGNLPGHVGMYVGAGYLVQAPHTGTKITVTPLSAWQSTIVAMRRIVPWPN